MTRTISITGKDRPELFQKTLTSLLTNDLKGWRITMAIEPGPKAGQFVEIADALLKGLDYDIRVNETLLGISLNPFELIDRNIRNGAELNLCLEEDLLLAPDATRMALWYQRNHRPYWLCLCLLAGPCGSASLISNPRHPRILFEARTFNAIGVALRSQEWPLLAAGIWKGEKKPHPLKGGYADWRYGWGWDWSVYGHVANHAELRCVQPATARATHNGPEGTYSKPEFHDKAFGKLALNSQPVEDFELVEVADLPHEIRSHVHAHEEMARMLLELEAAELRHRLGLPPVVKAL